MFWRAHHFAVGSNEHSDYSRNHSGLVGCENSASPMEVIRLYLELERWRRYGQSHVYQLVNCTSITEYHGFQSDVSPIQDPGYFVKGELLDDGIKVADSEIAGLGLAAGNGLLCNHGSFTPASNAFLDPDGINQRSLPLGTRARFYFEATSEGLLIRTTSSAFLPSDAGVYKCRFTDASNNVLDIPLDIIDAAAGTGHMHCTSR